MAIKAVFLDFYGTLVHEADEILPGICVHIQQNATKECRASEVGEYWWKSYTAMFQNSYGDSFQRQRALSLASLAETIAHYRSACIAEEVIQPQFDYWVQPRLYADTLPFLQAIRHYPTYIVSNIDKTDMLAAAAHHQFPVTGILTSEDVLSYKPRPELFLEALRRCGLMAEEVLHIGDSMTSDVAGAQGVGLKTMWLNRQGKPKPEGIEPDYICRDLGEAGRILLELSVR
ncbi:HAD family hydrolase [Paenibacillus sp. GCM10027626]|uniref:HAD family hydrolase n=1 Tax=Paenibacillus sp. GCM10027626 TaxID=3273411 RepID=UPI00363D856A